MDDYERTTVRRDTVADPVVDQPVAASSGYTTTERSVVRQGPSGGEMARRLVALLFGILQALIILRIVLLLLIANRDNGIVAFILSATDPFVEPFRGMFKLDRVSGGQGSVFDVAAVVALIAWTLIEAVVIAVLSIGSRRPTETV
jgi:uncharacterized protein YggT (Ycf19 family)